MTSGNLLAWIDPEIASLEAELASLSEELAAAEAALTEARGLLQALTRAHDSLLAPLYAELDEIEARIAEASATRSGNPDDLRDARAARAKADESATAANEAPRAGTVRPTARPPEVVSNAKSLYRALAKKCHPDLAADEADRVRREAFMVRLNDAYSKLDIEAIVRLSRELEDSVSAAPASDSGPGRLAWLHASVAAARRRLAQIRAELAEVTRTGIGVLLFPGGADSREPDMRTALERLDALADELSATITARREVLGHLRGDPDER